MSRRCASGLLAAGRAAARRRRARRWAQAMQLHNAVVLDTETTDLGGRICEVAVVDLNGRALLDTLVDPRCRVAAEATAVHGITDDDLRGAPTFAEVLPRLLAVTLERPVLAYNATYDFRVIHAEIRGAGLDGHHLTDPARWGCIMRARADAENGPWRQLGAAHRALGDATAAAAVLVALTG